MPTTAAWIIEARDWDDPRGVGLRTSQRAELDERYGCDDHEPGPLPSAADVSVFLMAFGPDGEALGCGALRELDESSAEVKRMYVVPESRGSGVAAALLAALEDAASAHGWTTVKLETGVAQPDAIRFYEREGYHRIPRFGHYADWDISVCYAKSLA
ncbi:GNAT family N-acetyltransferase [Glycomyces algeriensis]|uniref:N-acetyltransferase n=1 Tax=Glycomyces algeriensis TaxID=256037 RepID=A0A9W6GD78_9ACTN|nr:GNAT family N-acetyltransferase [Glycomyces algeriensis]MDA1367877.1 GNAT family N-acetyltransferase [Glycomyces algeriensis]MDR7352024.1 GNAT superfamily N-acetyltransferase [Glycomyces algeriensis]GLI44756.1 N-acetyltransferase [Glycomyces algeriensis]